MTAFGCYLHYNQVPVDGAIHAMLDGAFPAWGASRHINKQTEQKEQTRRQRQPATPQDAWDPEDD